MAGEKNVAKGSFSSRLALVLSIIALVLSIVAYNRTGVQNQFATDIKRIETRMQELKQETKKALDKISKSVKKQ